ncbi:MAG: hypothetical protein J6K87_00160 [Clostridia bacterium]|nr:hypothetical protein [Clostridia bacterium]
MPSENKNLEEIKDNESNISGGAWYDPRTWFNKNKESGAAENLLAQNPDSSPENPEDTKTNTENRPGNRRRR